MVTVSFGDLAQNLQLRRESARIDASIQQLSTELVTGRTTDLVGTVSGDLRGLSGIESSLQLADTRDVVFNEAGLVAGAAQLALGQISEDSNELANTLIVLDQASDALLVDAAAAEATSKFASAVTSLNTQVAGRSIFAGQAFDQPALADPTTILNDLYATVSVETNAADILTAVDAWFAPGGSFEVAHYTGAATADTIQLGNGEVANPPPIATDSQLVETLKGMAIGALVDMGVLSGQQNERVALARASGESLLTSQGTLVNARADLGIAQERIDTAKTRISFERTSLELARSEILDVDPYDTATRLQAAEAQLRTLFSITGRLSDLSLTNYLR